MSFLYPLFLAAGLTLAIPVLIHLFNLRKYKTVFFPHTRFLKNIQINSRRQSKVRYKWLLAARLLFLAFLIFAFAQPFFNKNRHSSGNKLQFIYIDNSNSMSVKKGVRTLLDIAKDAARVQLQHSHADTKYILLTNDKPSGYRPQSLDKAIAAINAIHVSPLSKNTNQVLSTVQSIMQDETAGGADLYYYSDFQQNMVSELPDTSLMKGLTFYAVPVQTAKPQNIYIDTAYLTTPVLQTGQNNKLVVRTQAIGVLPKDARVLQLSVNGQVKSAATLNFSDKNESIDTLNFQVNSPGWQRIELDVNDAAVRFDDTFRIAAHSAPDLSVLVLNEGAPDPYIEAAFHSYNGFRLTQAGVNAAPVSWKEYTLVILNGITRIDDTLAKILANALQQGVSVCVFPGRTNNFPAINEGLKQVGDLQITGMDTAVQTVSSIQQGSGLVKDIFERIPDNIQLPIANWHYIISSGLSANRQSILSFRNGDPFFARYTPLPGPLYICASGADLESGNFPGSYFFVPFLYRMAAQSVSSGVCAITSGSGQPVYMQMNNSSERQIVHVYGKGLDVIPPQHSNGARLNIYLDQAVTQPGFYTMAAPGTDTVMAALNQDRVESRLEVWDIGRLQSQWKGNNIKWMNITDADRLNVSESWLHFPLWKVCVILALLMLVAETYLLAGGIRDRKRPLAS